MADQARSIRVPVHMFEAVSKLARARRQMLQTWARSPPRGELAAELDMTQRRSSRCRSTAGADLLHTLLGEDGDSEFGDLIEDSEAIQPGAAVSFTQLQ
jgi:RNA polymerase primary sigma factor